MGVELSRPYYQDEAVTIYHGDCRDVLPEIGPVDYVITDPPYGIVNQFGVMEGNGRRTLQFEWDTPDITATVFAALAMAVVRAQSCFVFCGDDQFGGLLSIVRAAGLTAKKACWVKECPPPAGKGNWWPSGFELAVYGYRNGAWFGDTDEKRSNVFVSDSYRYGQPGKLPHPTQKPLRLIARLTASLVPPGETVLDPFMGSGTTLRAAKDLGRKAIGVEIEEKYCEIAAKRMSQSVMNFEARA